MNVFIHSFCVNASLAIEKNFYLGAAENVSEKKAKEFRLVYVIADSDKYVVVNRWIIKQKKGSRISD